MNYTHSAALWIVASGIGAEELRVINETLAAAVLSFSMECASSDTHK
ncbi:hypothetical protein J2T12_004429 [Paenibacillus anaericanus]|nr:hypothetical protein [Paenibacillus anaericanus]MDQ0091003.1 hypothetical protein [Paenibacillus anaericanus]